MKVARKSDATNALAVDFFSNLLRKSVTSTGSGFDVIPSVVHNALPNLSNSKGILPPLFLVAFVGITRNNQGNA